MFVQIIEGRTSNPDALKAAGEAWQKEVRPVAVGYLGVTAGTTADGKAFTIVRFEDEAAAKANSELPRAGRLVREAPGLRLRRPAHLHRVERHHRLHGRWLG